MSAHERSSSEWDRRRELERKIDDFVDEQFPSHQQVDTTAKTISQRTPTPACTNTTKRKRQQTVFGQGLPGEENILFWPTKEEYAEYGVFPVPIMVTCSGHWCDEWLVVESHEQPKLPWYCTACTRNSTRYPTPCCSSKGGWTCKCCRQTGAIFKTEPVSRVKTEPVSRVKTEPVNR